MDKDNHSKKKRKYYEMVVDKDDIDEEVEFKKKKKVNKNTKDEIIINPEFIRNIIPEHDKLENEIVSIINDNDSQIKSMISMFYYINGNKLSLNDLKDGRRIFNNKTEIQCGEEFKENFIEFRQLLFENLLLKEDFLENLKEQWTLESAIFSTFCYDEEFIEPLINKYRLKSLVVKHEENPKEIFIEKNDLLTFVHPKIDYTLRWGKFHSKLTILKFPNFLRVIIPSANLTGEDWYYWGQLIWFQDFPLKSKINHETTSDFEIYLTIVLENMLLKNYQEKKWFKKLNFNIADYDFSNTCVDLIASSSGRFSNTEKILYGIGRLNHLSQSYSKIRKTLNEYFSKIIVQSSSIGKSFKDKFISDICQGFSCRSHNSEVEIIYPTEEYINSFQMGPTLSSCLFLSQNTFFSNKTKFKIFEVNEPKYKTVFHSKFIVTCSKNEDLNPETMSDNTIFYFGSHNFSAAAWGSYEKKDSQVSMANFELGIIFNPIKLRYEEKQNVLKSLLINLNSRKYSEIDKPFIAELY